jgi:hypothetical protein
MEILLIGEVLYIFMDMRLSIICMVLLVIFPADSQGQAGWKLKRERNGISIYVREQADSPLKEYKARALFAHPIHQVFDFLSDLERHPEWVFRCMGLTIIEDRGEQKTKFHTTYDIPWPMKDRDLTAETVITHHAGGKKIESLSEDIILDYPVDKGVIRMPRYREWIILEEIDSLNTLFIVEGYADPGGTVPPWLVNMFLVDGIYDSVIKSREILLDQER